MIGLLLAYLRDGWTIESIDALSACWVVVKLGTRRMVPIPDGWSLPETAF